MLASVLLHVIEPPLPVDFARSSSLRNNCLHNVRYALVFIQYVDDGSGPDPPDVKRLASRRGIKCRPVQINMEVRGDRSNFHDLRLKLPEIAVRVIQALGHEATAPRRSGRGCSNSRPPSSACWPSARAARAR